MEMNNGDENKSIQIYMILNYLKATKPYPMVSLLFSVFYTLPLRQMRHDLYNSICIT